jgi:hypothetical protein
MLADERSMKRRYRTAWVAAECRPRQSAQHPSVRRVARKSLQIGHYEFSKQKTRQRIELRVFEKVDERSERNPQLDEQLSCSKVTLLSLFIKYVQFLLVPVILYTGTVPPGPVNLSNAGHDSLVSRRLTEAI